MKQVTKEQFYATVGQLDVHPYPHLPHETLWKLRNHTLVGVSHPGYKHSFAPQAYFINEQHIKVPA